MLAAFWAMAAGRLAVTFATGLLTFVTVRAALDARGWIRPFWTNLVEVDDSGVHVRLAGVGEIRFAWPGITGIRRQKRTATTGGFWPVPYRADDYILSTARGPLSFTSMDIPGARRTAPEIAALPCPPRQER